MEINNIEEYLNKKKEEYNNKFNYMLIDPEFTKSESPKKIEDRLKKVINGMDEKNLDFKLLNEKIEEVKEFIDKNNTKIEEYFTLNYLIKQLIEKLIEIKNQDDDNIKKLIHELETKIHKEVGVAAPHPSPPEVVEAGTAVEAEGETEPENNSSGSTAKKSKRLLRWPRR